MRLSKLFSVLVLAAVVFISGCRSGPVYNIDSNAIPTTDNISLKKIQKAIVSACFGLGWQAKVQKPGHVVATLNLRSHVAVVDIKFSTKSYSIKYKDSVDLDYDGTNIHSNYNGWIRNLDNKVKLHLSML